MEVHGEGRRGVAGRRALLGGGAVSQGLPVELLPGAVDAPVGVEERGRARPARRAVVETEVARVQAQVLALARQEEEALALEGGGGLEQGDAVLARGLALDGVVPLLPVVLVEGDVDAGQNPARRAVQRGHLHVPVHLLPREKDDRTHREVDREDSVLGLLEVLPRRSGHDVRPGRQDGRIGVGAVLAVVGRRVELGLPGGRGPLGTEDGLDLSPLGQEVVVAGRGDALEEVHGVGAEVDGVQVLVRHREGAAPWPVEAHALDAEVWGLDGGHQVCAALAAHRGGVGALALERDGAGADQRVGGVRILDELRLNSLAHGVPGHGTKPLHPALEVREDDLAVRRFGERVVEAAQALEARLELGVAVPLLRVPSLQVAEDSDDLADGMRRGVLQDGLSGGARGPVGDEGLGVEAKEVVGLGRRPEARVGEELRVEVGHGVAEGVPHALGVVVGADVLLEDGDGFVAEGGPVHPGPEIGLLGLGEELVAGPGLEVHGALGLDLLALADLPGVHVAVLHDGVAVEEVEGDAVQRVLRPGLLLQAPHGGLVPVQAHAELGEADERLRPVGLVPRGPGGFEDLLDHRRGGLELLLVDEVVHGLPAGSRGLRCHGLPSRSTRHRLRPLLGSLLGHLLGEDEGDRQDERTRQHPGQGREPPARESIPFRHGDLLLFRVRGRVTHRL